MIVCQRQFGMGLHRAGMVARIWADCDLIHVLIAGIRIKTVRSQLSVSDLARLELAPSPLDTRQVVHAGRDARYSLTTWAVNGPPHC